MDKIQRIVGTALRKAAIDAAEKECGSLGNSLDATIEGLAVLMRMDDAELGHTIANALNTSDRPFMPVEDWQLAIARRYADAANLYDRIRKQVDSFGDAEAEYALDRFGHEYYENNVDYRVSVPGANDECDAGLMMWCRVKADECADKGYTTNELYIGDVVTDILHW